MNYPTKEEECLEAILRVAEIQARQILLELHMPRLVPIWVMIGGDGKVDILPTPWEDEHEKQSYADMVRILMRKRKVVAYSFLTEAWMAILDEEEFDEKTGRPHDGIMEARHRPDRQETVIACACTATMSRWRRWRIVREATTERIIKLEEQPHSVGEEEAAESWLTEMLKI
jgi:hypothetical protein